MLFKCGFKPEAKFLKVFLEYGARRYIDEIIMSRWAF